MKEKIIIRFLVFVWWTMLRDWVQKAVNDPESEIDDMIIGLVDRMLPQEGVL